MYITGLYIDGFGMYAKTSLEEIPPGLVLITGANESGKTTLMEFICSALFGFPSRRSRDFYPPLRGGNHGGRIQIKMTHGARYTLHLTPRNHVLRDSHGGEMEGRPHELFHGIDRQIYKSIFAIGLKDLQGLEVLTRDEIRSRILAAGTGLGTKTLSRAFETLELQAKKLLRSRAKSSIIKNILERYQNVAKSIRDLQEETSHYSELHNVKTELDTAIQQAQSERVEVSKRLRHIERLLQALPIWLALEEDRKALAKVQHAASFPPRGRDRFIDLKEKISEMDERIQQTDLALKRIDDELEHLTVHESLLNQKDDIQRLSQEREKLLSAMEDLPALKAELEKAESDFKKCLLNIGPGWDIQKIKKADVSVGARQEARKFAEKFKKLSISLEQCESDYKLYSKKLDDLNVNLKKYQNNAREYYSYKDVSENNLMTQKERLELRRDALREVKEIDSAVAIEQEKLRHIEITHTLITRTDSFLKGLFWILEGVGIAMILASLLRSFDIGMVAAGGMLVILGLFLMAYRKRKEEIKGGIFGGISEHETRKNDILANIRRLEVKRRELDKVLEDTAVGFDEGAVRTVTSIENEIRKIERDHAKVLQLREIESHIREIEDDIEKVQSELAKTEQRKEEFCSQRKSLQEEWSTWLSNHGYVSECSVEGFDVLLQALETAAAEDKHLVQIKERVQDLQDYITRAISQIDTVWNKIETQRTSGEMDPLSRLDKLTRALQETLQASSRKQEWLLRRKELKDEITRLHQKLDTYKKEISELWSKTGALNEDEFLRKVEEFEQYTKLNEQVNNSEKILKTMIGNMKNLPEFEDELSRVSLEKLEQERNELMQQEKEIVNTVGEWQQKMGEIQERLSRLNTEDRLGLLLMERQALQTELEDAIHQWAVRIVCQRLMEQARTVYERERQPKVVREADRILKRITGGGYRLFTPVDGKEVILEDTNMGYKGEAAWSSGLADQVYLAIRLGLAMEFGKTIEPLPILLDDILVRYDPERQEGAVRAILETAERCQVFFFTCRPEVAQLVKTIIEGNSNQPVAFRVYHLDNGILREE